MIYVNGIRLRHVVNIECNEKTGFNTVIDFLYDSRLTKNNPLLALMDYDLQQLNKESKEDLGEFRIIVPNEKHIEIDR